MWFSMWLPRYVQEVMSKLHVLSVSVKSLDFSNIYCNFFCNLHICYSSFFCRGCCETAGFLLGTMTTKKAVFLLLVLMREAFVLF